MKKRIAGQRERCFRPAPKSTFLELEERMPTFVDPSKCDGCKGGEKTAFMYICPNDLMILDPDAMRAYNQ